MADRPDQLNIFLAELSEEDVCATMYLGQYPTREATTTNGKVSLVCRQVREELERQDNSEHKVDSLLPVLGTLVRDGARLEEALARVKVIADAGLNAKANEALKFLLYMVDVNALFDVALGTYDFDL